jgi:hypothetical protein
MWTNRLIVFFDFFSFTVKRHEIKLASFVFGIFFSSLLNFASKQIYSVFTTWVRFLFFFSIPFLASSLSRDKLCRNKLYGNGWMRYTFRTNTYVRNSIYSRNKYYNILYTVSGVYYDKVKEDEFLNVQFRFVEVSGHNLKSSQSRRFQCLHY